MRDAAEYLELVDRLFCRHDAPYGPYERNEPPEIVVPNFLVRAKLYRPGYLSDRYEVSIFDGIQGSLAGELWEHEVRSLLRLEALNHPALPRIVGGSYQASDGIAFTITLDMGGHALNIDETVRAARANPIQAFEQFSVLLDALSHLHGAQMLHRNLTTGALRAVQLDGEEHATIQLARFEMSTLIGNIVRRTGFQNAERDRELIRRLYLTPPPGVEEARHLAYLAPEMHDYLFDDRSAVRRDWETTDIFGMGVLGWEWFCGAIPEILPEEYAAVSATEGPGKALALARLHEGMRRHLVNRHQLPRPLVTLLGNMLADAPGSRDTSFQALRYLEQNWEGIRGVWEEDEGDVPHLVAFMPLESKDRIYSRYRWISRSPEEPAGRDELKAFLEEELRKAELVRSPTGAVGYATDEPDKLAEAEWVLIGERAVWFCAYLYDEDLVSRRRGERHEDTLVIKYLKAVDHARELVSARPRRRVGRIDVVPFYPGQSLGQVRKGRPSWRPLTDSVEKGRGRGSEDTTFLKSLDFLLEYQRAQLDARIYAYTRVDKGDEPGLAVLQYDRSRDDRWRHHRSALLNAYCMDERRRPRLATFVENLDSENGTINLDIVGENTRKRGPSFGRTRIKVELDSSRDRDTLVVRPPAGMIVPSSGWLRPSEDGGAEIQMTRQSRARTALESQAGLIRNLRAPIAFDLGRGRWAAPADDAERLEGAADDRVRDMLALQPLYALQGPPGTGKTTVAAHAVRRYLEVEPGARVLISAQSNFALDNLAERLIRTLPPDTLILRETPDLDNIKDPKIREHTLVRLTERLAEQIQDTLTWMLQPQQLPDHKRRKFEELPEWRRPAALTDKDRPLAKAWLERIRSNQIELTERIKSGASVVLATCSIAGTLTDAVRDPSDMFDWVILEEAAKAWPTEMIIPLVLGARWTLIGDHRQLGAFREQEVKSFLDSLHNQHDEDMQRHYKARQERLRVLRLFGSLFDQTTTGRRAQTGQVVPLGVLDMQFRMHKKLAEPVGRAFYPLDPPELDENGLPLSFLDTADRASVAHRVHEPDFLRDQPLVWLDTTDAENCDERPFWSNLGEVDLVDRLVGRMLPAPLDVSRSPDEDGGLVVLTPYLLQKKMLDNKGQLRGRVHTVHSFQGREADRVIVSLVRSEESGNTVAGNVGHVGQPEVVNVLLSRARRLLVLVGNYRHFARNGGVPWKIVTDTVRQHGVIVPASELRGS